MFVYMGTGTGTFQKYPPPQKAGEPKLLKGVKFVCRIKHNNDISSSAFSEKWIRKPSGFNILNQCVIPTEGMNCSSM